MRRIERTLVDGSVGQVTDSSSLNDVADSESLDGLVLGDSASTVGASHKGDVASAGLVAAVVCWREVGKTMPCKQDMC